jgi:hypothetical protein
MLQFNFGEFDDDDDDDDDVFLGVLNIPHR